MEIYRQKLDHQTGRSHILVGGGLLDNLDKAAPDYRHWTQDRTVFVISTPRLQQLHGEAIRHLIAGAARHEILEVEDGEGAKSLAHAGDLWQAMLARGGKRDSRLVTFGGGTVGDLGGFVASCFLRGIEYTQVPTTLLAQVDASVGGKTGVDLPKGKNTVGAFHHPQWVLAETDVLKTLPRGELRSGLVEVIKMAALLDPDLLSQVEERLEGLLDADSQALGPVIAAAIGAKCAVVEEDEKEGDRRRVLNFGHTLGHAIEGVLEYEHLRHGEAVAYGMLFAHRLAQLRGGDPALAQRIQDLLSRLELPPLPPLDRDALIAFMGRDKKATEEGLVWVLPHGLGQDRMVQDISRQELQKELADFLCDPFDAVGQPSRD